jgi:hypothetical protein
VLIDQESYTTSSVVTPRTHTREPKSATKSKAVFAWPGAGYDYQNVKERHGRLYFGSYNLTCMLRGGLIDSLKAMKYLTMTEPK